LRLNFILYHIGNAITVKLSLRPYTDELQFMQFHAVGTTAMKLHANGPSIWQNCNQTVSTAIKLCQLQWNCVNCIETAPELQFGSRIAVELQSFCLLQSNYFNCNKTVSTVLKLHSHCNWAVALQLNCSPFVYCNQTMSTAMKLCQLYWNCTGTAIGQ
jgi:hypothetical protein